MNGRLLFLLVVLVTCILVFAWGATNYLRCYTDTPSGNSFELCPTNTDVHAMPAIIVTFVMIGIVPILTWMLTKDKKHRIILVTLSGVGIFFAFVGILILIIHNLN